MTNVFSRLFASGQTLQQYGALCFRFSGASCEVALVTSRGTGRFIIPKGWPETGLSPHEAAAREAEEEAGLVGEIAADAIGSYKYTKRLHLLASIKCRVAVFPMRVTGELEHWSEKQERRRVWMSPLEAAEAVKERGLRDIIRAFGEKRHHT